MSEMRYFKHILLSSYLIPSLLGVAEGQGNFIIRQDQRSHRVAFANTHTLVNIYDVKSQTKLHTIDFIQVKGGNITVYDSSRGIYDLFIDIKPGEFKTDTFTEVVIKNSGICDTIPLRIVKLPKPRATIETFPFYMLNFYLLDSVTSGNGEYNDRPISVQCEYNVLSFDVELYSKDSTLIYRESNIGKYFSAECRNLSKSLGLGSMVWLKNVKVISCDGTPYLLENVLAEKCCVGMYDGK